MNFHPLANIFPLIEGGAFDDLVADIAKHGVREPVWLYEGQILDGRNRWRAAQQAGVECPTRVYGGDDPARFVVSLNLHRRHLSESQRQLVAAKLATLEQGRPETGQLAGLTQSEAAELLNVGERGVRRARVVFEAGSPELVAAVESGVASVFAAADVATLPQSEQAEIVARGEREILEAAKKIRAAKLDARRIERIDMVDQVSRRNAPLGAVAARYPVLYVDPPWRYDYAESESRAIENQYPTMSLDEIKDMAIGDVAFDDCVLFMWATSPKLSEAFEVLSAWGFSYRTCAVWDKQKIGMGYYFRQQHELLLVATRGVPPAPAPADRPPSVFSYPRGAHSAKPQEVYEVIEAMYPQLPKLELFSRSPRSGWGAWGNQAA